MIEVGNIVTLENTQEYLLLEELKKENHHYIYAVRVVNDEIATDEYLIFEALKKDNDDYLKVVSDKTLYDELIDEFRDIVADKILDGALDNVEEGVAA